ncbi:hypothetical protein [Parageobacillus thermoglucosidasius]|uniref:hypothetical protein n=1 Tax=Parageobacillus thermoglucosidasius TaxID=1426 RepID=UPI0027F978B5|nr:hypothetical protein PthstB1num2_19860 [Parageobacillus thermoglucosidasius]
MKWSELRRQCPNQFVLVEAISAYSQNGKRIIEEMEVIDWYHSASDAWNGYKQQHKTFPAKELYIFHTSKEEIEVEEQYFIGIRGRV